MQAPTKAHNLPTLQALNSKIYQFCPLWVSENPEETPKHLKENLIFAPFQPISATFKLFEVLPIVQSRPDAPSPALSSRMQERKPTRKEGQGTREREEGKGKGKGKREAHKPTKRGTPPPQAGSRQPFPSTIFRAKKSAKSHLGCFEKIFGKIFRWNVSGKEKPPRVISTEGGCLTNENREISNLAMQKPKTHKSTT